MVVDHIVQDVQKYVLASDLFPVFPFLLRWNLIVVLIHQIDKRLVRKNHRFANLSKSKFFHSEFEVNNFVVPPNLSTILESQLSAL